MSNPIKKEYDKISLAKDIAERESIVKQFQTTGLLDRNDTIAKILSIQLTDPEIAIATQAQQMQYGIVNLHQVDNPVIIMNLQFQIDVLKAKLVKLELEEKGNGRK